MSTPRTNPKVDEFLSKANTWKEESIRLRSICLDSKLTEYLKWRQPCYTFQQGNVVIISAFKEYCALGFFKGSLLRDEQGLLDQPGEHSRAMRHLRFTSVEQIDEMEPIVRAYIDEAIELEKSGASVDFSEGRELPIPEELLEKFDEVPAFKTAFDALTPVGSGLTCWKYQEPSNRRLALREWKSTCRKFSRDWDCETRILCVHLSQAAKERCACIEMRSGRIFDGFGLNECYCGTKLQPIFRFDRCGRRRLLSSSVSRHRHFAHGSDCGRAPFEPRKEEFLERIHIVGLHDEEQRMLGVGPVPPD